VAEGGGLLNADQHFGHRRFSQQRLETFFPAVTLLTV
jgi:hypothetical protein